MIQKQKRAGSSLATYTTSAKKGKKRDMMERMNNTVCESKGTKRIKTVGHNAPDLTWQWNLLDNMSSSRGKRQSMLGPHYTLKSSTKKKPKKGGNIAIDFYDQGDSRCSSSVGQHTHDELKNASLVNIKFAGIEGDGSLSTNLNTAKKGALRMADGVRHPGVRKGGKSKRPVSRHHMQTMKSSVGNSKKNPRSKSNYHTTDFRTGAQFRENGLDQASFHQSIYKLREMIQQNEHQSKGRKNKKRKAVKNDRNYSNNMKGRLDQSYTGDLTPNSFFCTDY